MELKIRKNSKDYIVDTIGEMDLYNSYKLKELVNKMIEKGVKSIVLNLDQTEYIDSSGIGALIYRSRSNSSDMLKTYRMNCFKIKI